MNRDEIMRMAREAHGPITGQWWDMDAAALEHFYRAAYEAGAAAEREECAKVCEEKPKETFSEHCQVWGNFFARAIRARGKA